MSAKVTKQPDRKPPHAQFEQGQKAYGMPGEPSTTPKSQRVCRRPKVREMIGLGDSSIYSMMDPKSPQFDPDFPRPVRLGKRAVAWREAEILDWLNSRQRTAA